MYIKVQYNYNLKIKWNQKKKKISHKLYTKNGFFVSHATAIGHYFQIKI